MCSIVDVSLFTLMMLMEIRVTDGFSLCRRVVRKVETMLTNTGAAFDDPFYGYIESGQLYFSDRNTGISTINLNERNRSLTRTDYPYVIQNTSLSYYGQGLSYGAMNAAFGK